MYDYLNYYSVSDKLFKNKLFALSYFDNSDREHKVKWHLPAYENYLSSIDISLDPQESLKTVYLQRALYLREKYDYLVLFYSGGYDSHNILETFLLNNIPLDEVCIYQHSKSRILASFNKLEVLIPDYYEPLKAAIPQAEYLIAQYAPKTKLTVLENFEEKYVEFWKSQTSLNKKLVNCSSIGILHKFNVRTKDVTLLNPSWRNLLQNKKLAFIYGKEKVRLKENKLGVFFQLSDIDLVDHVDIHFINSLIDLPNNIELFYMCPKIHLKQAHEIIKHNNYSNILKMHGGRAMENAISKIIYDIKYNIIFTGMKYSDFKPRDFNNNYGAEDSSDTNLLYFLYKDKESAWVNYKNYINCLEDNFFSGDLRDAFFKTNKINNTKSYEQSSIDPYIVHRFKKISWSNPYYIKTF